MEGGVDGELESIALPVNPGGSPRIAVVGSGPAAMGATLALLERFPSARILVADHAPSASSRAAVPPPDAAGMATLYEGIYREIWRERPRAFPPPKTHFAAPLPKFPIQGGGSVFSSQQPGGLSNFWGGTSLPFTAREFAALPLHPCPVDPRFLGQFAQHAGFGLLACFQCPLDQLRAGVWMAEGQDLPAIPLLAEDDGTNFVDIAFCLAA